MDWNKKKEQSFAWVRCQSEAVKVSVRSHAILLNLDPTIIAMTNRKPYFHGTKVILMRPMIDQRN